MIPGSNILRMALTIIARNSVVAYQFASRTLNSIGLYDVTYSDPISISGSFQPVPRQLYREYGLDFQQSYFTFYTDQLDLIDIQRGSSGDQITFGLSAPTIIGSPLENTLIEFKVIANGSFNLTIGSTTNLIQNLNFSSVLSFYDCAAIIQSAINSQTGLQWTNATVSYDISNNSFNFLGGDNNTKDAISVSAGTSGLDISSIIGWFPQSSTTIWNNGKNQLYQVESSNDWYKIDGWSGVLCIEVSGEVD